MKSLPHYLLILLLSLTIISCHTDRDDEIVPPTSENLQVENFIYRAMNLWYLYKPNVPALADDRFASQDELNSFLRSFESPEDLFYEGVKAPRSLDRFSIITDDYRELERSFAGIGLSNGMEYGLIGVGNDRAVGIVRYVLPNSSAEAEGIERGMAFTEIDGNPLTIDGNSLSAASIQLLNQNSYSIRLAEFVENSIIESDVNITLTKEEYTENPVYLSKTFDNIAGQKVGYLMYNSFTANFDEQLNAVFADFKSAGVNELVLDLRYNGGGSVRTATDLATMITGQFAEEIFATEVFNPQVQAFLEEDEPEDLNIRFNTQLRTGEAINSLNLTRLYVLTTRSTASASELVINGLDPYIDVIQIGTNTTGKFQASTTFYDSENFGRQGASPNHFYAIQPLIFTTANADGVTGFIDGITPDIEMPEQLDNYGILGDENEPLLRVALDDIRGVRTYQQRTKLIDPEYTTVGESGMDNPTFQRMYTEAIHLRK